MLSSRVKRNASLFADSNCEATLVAKNLEAIEESQVLEVPVSDNIDFDKISQEIGTTI